MLHEHCNITLTIGLHNEWCSGRKGGSLDLPSEEGRKGKKGKNVSLGWGVQALLFSTLNIEYIRKHIM